MASKIPQSSTSCTKYIKGGRLTETLFLCPTYEEKIRNIIKNLKSGSAAGWDEISTKIVKSSCFHIRVMLRHIFNLSFLSGIFPNELKIARVVPLFKSHSIFLIIYLCQSYPFFQRFLNGLCIIAFYLTSTLIICCIAISLDSGTNVLLILL